MPWLYVPAPAPGFGYEFICTWNGAAPSVAGTTVKTGVLTFSADWTIGAGGASARATAGDSAITTPAAAAAAAPLRNCRRPRTERSGPIRCSECSAVMRAVPQEEMRKPPWIRSSQARAWLVRHEPTPQQQPRQSAEQQDWARASADCHEVSSPPSATALGANGLGGRRRPRLIGVDFDGGGGITFGAAYNPWLRALPERVLGSTPAPNSGASPVDPPDATPVPPFARPPLPAPASSRAWSSGSRYSVPVGESGSTCGASL